MKKIFIVIPLLTILVLGNIGFSYGQTPVIANHVVINEVDTNPPGDESQLVLEWVELYNPTSSNVDISGWKVAATTGMKKVLQIPQGTVVAPGKFVTFYFETLWFTNNSEMIELRDKNDVIIDKTPLISDLQNDHKTWQRIYDGYDTDSSGDWKFFNPSPGSSNGKYSSDVDVTPTGIVIETDKSNYLFGETVLISGSVSEQKYVEKPFFSQAPINIVVKGPMGFYKEITLYPDLNLNFKTSLGVQSVLGFSLGQYTISAEYGGALDQAFFQVSEQAKIVEEKEKAILTVRSDKSSYLPGQVVRISASTSEIVPLEGFNFKVFDSKGKQISIGSLFPTPNKTGGGDFSTTVYITNISPPLGQYSIVATYGTQVANTFFDVIPDIKEEKLISLWTDKEVYALGDTVKITGRLNQVWVNALDLEVLQTKSQALSGQIADGSFNFKIKDILRIEGDGSFSYSFKIPADEKGLGDYRIKISKDLGESIKVIQVVLNPETYEKETLPITVKTNKDSYDMNEKITISGLIQNPKFSTYETKPVSIIISNEDGSPLEIVGLKKAAQTRVFGGVVVAYVFTAIPDQSGRYQTEVAVDRSAFAEGVFHIKAEYGDIHADTSIIVMDSKDVTDKIVATLDKQVYGLGETVTLTGLVKGTSQTGVSVSLIKPDGKKLDSGAHLDGSRFEWTWVTPNTSSKPSSLDTRSVLTSNIGVYKIRLNAVNHSEDFFFKVSEDPENESPILDPISIETDKPIYKLGERLLATGTVILKQQGTEGLVIPEQVKITVVPAIGLSKISQEANVYPDQGGNFQSVIDLPQTVFTEGVYKAKGIYSNKRAESIFSIAKVFDPKDPIKIILNTDKTQYYPGDKVRITGQTSKLVYLEEFGLSVIQGSSSNSLCGQMICGKTFLPSISIETSPTATFEYEIQIPDATQSIGKYEVIAKTDFDSSSKLFEVIEKPEVIPEIITGLKTIEKFTRIPDSKISINVEEKADGEDSLFPRTVEGTLVAPRGDEQNVNLKITHESGVCVIGQSQECLVKNSTKSVGTVFNIVKVDGFSYKVRYSGPDAKIEKFTILPESTTGVLPNSTWNIIIEKEDQPSRFYYKINYILGD